MKIRCTTSTILTATAAALAMTAVNCSYGQDECAGAPPIAANTPTAYSTVSATPSANIPTDALCAGTYLNWLDTQNDVWFTFTASEPGLAEFTTCDPASYDTSLALYKGTCGNLIACNGDGTGGSGCQVYYSRIADVACQAGDLFFIRIGGYNAAVGAGNMTVNFTASSASCVGATGACNVAHGGLGCDNPTCCTNICTLNPLCCEIGWDGDCVTLAIQQCGYYFCAPVGGAPANNCATSATAISSTDSTVNFNSAGATMDGPSQPGQCASGNEFFYNDIWYKVSPIANGTMGLSTCGAVGYDNKLAVYDMGTNPASFNFNAIAASLVGCIDDGASGTCFLTDGTTPYAAEMEAGVELGHTYLIRIGSYEEIGMGPGTMIVNMPEACTLPTPTGSEGEDCGLAINDGCNGDGGSISVGPSSITSGTFWAEADTSGNGNRDTDFYTVSVGSDTSLTASVHAGRLVTVLVLTGDLSIADCTGVTVVAEATGTCPSVATYCMNAGSYHIFVADADFAGNPCGSGIFNDYTLSVTTAAASCPITVSGGGATAGTCDAAGPNSFSINTNPDTVTGGVVACAYGNGAFPNCASGGTTVNSYARVFPAGQLTGDISCINFGAYCVVRATNTAGTACGLYYSDVPLPAQLGIYRDLDGGAPRRTTVDGGVDGGDLEAIVVQEVRVPGGVYRATLNFSEPVCVMDDTANNLVVVIEFPLVGGTGYSIRAGSNTFGPGMNTYCRLSCADAAGQFVLTESLGATFTAQWVCQLNGTNGVNCGAPSCPADFNGDGLRDGLDMTVILSNWGGAGGDVNSDGTTDGLDMTVLLSGWGICP